VKNWLNRISLLNWNRRKAFLVLYGIIFTFFAIPYGIHLSRLAAAAASISLREHKQLEKINDIRHKIEADFLKQYPDQEYVLGKYLHLEQSRTSSDTLISYFIFENSLTIHDYNLNYFACWEERIHSEASQLKAEQLIDKSIAELEKTHGNNARIWLNRLGKKRFVKVIQTSCAPYYEEMESHRFDPEKIDDFDRFLSEYSLSEAMVDNTRETIQKEYEETIKELKRGLSAKEQELIDEQLRLTPGIVEDKKRFRFQSDHLGDFDYSIPSPVIDYDRLNDAIEIALNEHYQDHSLRTGSMPYSYCYGANNSGSSSIRVNTGGQDVLVLIKNRFDEVVRHVYIQKYDSFTLRMPNGQYKVHFYHGKGWNPKKFMKESSCGRIKGGFIYYESLQKDPEWVFLFNQDMYYTLQRTAGGNFSTAGSSVSEAF
jgi:hypothetical protein